MSHTNRESKMRRLVLSALSLWLACAATARAEIRTSFLMHRDPEIQVPATIQVVSPALKPLWREALARPEADMQRLAADAIMRAHSFGMPGLDDAVPRLEAIVAKIETHPSARLAAARALVELGAKRSADAMAASARQFGADLRQIIEPALARWDYRPMHEEWQARLKNPRVRHRDLVLAIRCLTLADDKS